MAEIHLRGSVTPPPKLRSTLVNPKTFQLPHFPRLTDIKPTSLSLQIVLLALAYFFMGRLGVLTALPPGLATTVWPASGLALAALLLRGNVLWPGIFFGSLLVNFPTLISRSQDGTIVIALFVSFLVALGSTLQAWVGSTLIQRVIHSRLPFGSASSVFKFTAIETLTCTVASTIGTFALKVSGLLGNADLLETWATWSMGDLGGILIITPLLLNLRDLPAVIQRPVRMLEGSLLLVLTAVVSLFIFGPKIWSGPQLLPYLSIPLTLWAAFRFSQIGASICALIVSAVAIWGTSHGYGSFISDSLSINHSLLLLQTFIGVTAVIGLSIAGSLVERSRIARRGERFKFLSDYGKDAHYLIDLDGRFVYVNKEAVNQLGFSEFELSRMTIWDIDCDLPLAEKKNILNRVVSGEPLTFETAHRRKDGASMPVEISARAYNIEGSLLMFAVARDISQRKTAELALQKQAEALERSNLDLQQFASVASHDLKSPLRVVSHYLYLLQERNRGKMESDSLELIELSLRSAKKMSNLIDSLLEHSRAGWNPPRLESLDTHELVTHLVSEFRPAIEEKNASVLVHPLPTIRGDLAQLGMVFQNLLANALKFTLTTDRRPQVEISARENDREWIFEVTDNGIGIEKHQINRIFDIFHRLHSEDLFPGHGIGLATTKKIVEKHGGTVGVNSEIGKGSTFYFTVPKVLD